MAKHIFITGGVSSSLGKGMTAASLGRLLKNRGLRVTIQKLDPYLNVDPGTMNPYEHGEVFVTTDGAETDLDLGHYERFIDENLTRASAATTGAIYQQVIAAERRGDYLGKTVQVIPHVTDAIKGRIAAVALDVDVVITEVGGTVGDIEILPFLEAIRQFRKDVGRDNVCYIHLTLVPYLGTSGEQKTKPTQHSVTELRSRGIQPDVLVCRSDRPIPDSMKAKLSASCDVPLAGVINAADAESIYEIPLNLHEQGLDSFVCELLHLQTPEPDLGDWRKLVSVVREAPSAVTIGLVGKYTDLQDAYLSVAEAVRHGGFANNVRVNLDWVRADDAEGLLTPGRLEHLDSVVIPGGFGNRGVEGKIDTARWAREAGVPCLGLCLGLQAMVIDYARHVAELAGAHSTEFAPDTTYPVIDLLPDQHGVVDRGGSMRLGAYIAYLAEDSQVRNIYGSPVANERHRHRYEVNPGYRRLLANKGLSFSGTSPDGRLVEFIELPGHPFWVGTQAHPEFQSRPDRAHPLFSAFVAAAMARRQKRVDPQRHLRLLDFVPGGALQVLGT